MLKFIISACILCCTGSLLAIYHPEPGSFGITGEYLYLMPTLDDTYFVTKGPSTDLIGKRENNNFDFRSGYRVAAAYACCDCDRDVVVAYTHLSAKQQKEVSGNALWATVTFPYGGGFSVRFSGTATSALHLNYECIEGIFSQNVFDFCNFGIRLLAGMECDSLRLHEGYVYLEDSGASSTTTKKCSTWGVGPEVGFALEYKICHFTKCLPGSLCLNLLSTGSILAGQTDAQMNNRDTSGLGGSMDTKDEKAWRAIPALHARVGVNYSACICKREASLAVGYEFNSYYRGLAREMYYDEMYSGLCFTNYYNFDTQGLYVSASFSF